MSLPSISCLSREIDTISTRIQFLENQLNALSLSSQQIIGKISFLEIARADLDWTIQILPRLQRNNSRHNLQVALSRVEEVWQRCYNTCQNAHINQIAQMTFSIKEDEKSFPLLQKLRSTLKMLSLNPWIGSEQKKSIETILQEVEAPLLRLEEKISKEQQFRAECKLLQLKMDGDSEEAKAYFLTLSSETQTVIFKKLISLFDSSIVFRPILLSSCLNRFTAPQIKAALLDLDQKEKSKRQEENAALERVDYSSMLPDETLLKVLSELSPETLLYLAQVSKRLNALCSDSKLWEKTLSAKKGIHLTTKEDYLRYKRIYEKLPKGLYTVQPLEGHKNKIKCLLQQGCLLFSCSDDTTIKIWDLTSGKCTATLKNNWLNIASPICLLKEGDFLFSGKDFFGAIEIWDLRTKKCSATLNNGYPVVCLQKEKDLLFSLSTEATLKVWDLITKKCITTQHNVFGGYFPDKKGDHLLLASKDQKFQIWDCSDLRNIQWIATLSKKHLPTIVSLARKENLLILGLQNGTIDILDLRAGKIVATLRGHKITWVYGLQSEGNLLFSYTHHETKIWDLTTHECITTLERVTDYDFGPRIFLKERNHLFLTSYKGDWDYVIRNMDLNASFSDLLKAADEILQSGNLARFCTFGESCKKAIYEELRNIEFLPPDKVEHAFLNEARILRTSNQKKAQAVYRFVLREILSRLEQGSPREALGLFKGLPDAVKIAVYKEFCAIVPLVKDDHAESAYLGLSDQPISNEDRIKAILNYLDYTSSLLYKYTN